MKRADPTPGPAAGPLDDDLVLLLDTLQASVETDGDRAEALRQRLFDRVARSAAASRLMSTVRRAQAPFTSPAPGVRQRALYQAGRTQPLRPGEPLRTSWIELAPGTRWSVPAAGSNAGALQRDWLVVQGQAAIDGEELAALDYRVVPAAGAVQEIASHVGATLYLREALRAAVTSETPAEAATHGEWADFAPGVQRRVLWARGREAAMLYRAEPGAKVPCHRHGHDEECLMLQGELFLDDVLLRSGEYQLAPAGTGHGGLYTDTGAVIYAHGDLDLDLVADGA